VFSSPSDAVRAAVELQARFRREEDPDLPLRVGIGLDVGEALASQGGYVGKAPILAERLCGLAAPGEVLASEGLIRAVGELQVVMYRERGAIVLKGFPEPIRVVEVLAEEAPR
jgi:class 3 adenylate cyclase